MDFNRTLKLITESNDIPVNLLPVSRVPRDGNNVVIDGKEGYIYRNTIRGIKVVFKTEDGEQDWDTDAFKLVKAKPIGSLKSTIDYNKNKASVNPQNSRFD